MARTRPGSQMRIAAFYVVKLAAFGVEPVEHHAVDAEVRGEREAIGWIGDDAVSVRCLLAFRVRPAAHVLRDVRRRREAAGFLNRQERDVAAGIVRHEHDASPAIHAHVAGRATLRRLLVDSR